MNTELTAGRALLLDRNYLRIFVSPRATIRQIVDRNPRDRVIALVAIAGLVGVIAYTVMYRPTSALAIGAKSIPVMAPATLRKLFLAEIIGSPIISVIFLYIRAAILRWSGAMFGGTSDAVNVRAALAWASVPSILFSLILIAFAMLVPPTSVAAGDPHFLFATIKANWPHFALSSVLSLYTFIIVVNCIAEVHDFSAWRALGAIAIELLLLLGALLVVLVTAADIFVLLRG